MIYFASVVRFLGKYIAAIHEASQKWLAEELARAGLDGLAPSHGDILACLYSRGEATMRELADFAHRTRPTTTVLVDKMEALGLVARERSEVDTRSQIVRLTDRGKSMRGKFNSISERYVKLLSSGISQRESEEVESALSKILSNMQRKRRNNK